MKLRFSKYDKNGSLGNKPRCGKYKNCVICNVQYYVKPSHASGSLYCSYKCKYDSQKNRLVIDCKKCGKKVERPVNRIKWTKKRGYNPLYCSAKCRGEDKRTDWNGKTEKKYNQNIRWSAQFKEWRKAVFERDDYTCQRCCIRGGYLEPHHIFRFAYFPEFRFTIANGMTLCRGCHQLTKKKDKLFKLIKL